MKYSKKSILISFLFLVLAIALSLNLAQAISYGGLGIQPHQWDPENPLTKSWFIYTLGPGETKRLEVDVINSSNKPMDIKIYPVDAVTTQDGAFAPEPEDKEKVSVGAWITLSKSEVSLRPKETTTIEFTIKVPENVEVGDHMGAIIAQNKEIPEVEEETAMRIVTRVGARIYLTIPGEIIRKLEFEKFTWKLEEREVIFHLDLSNKGNVRISPKGEIEIKNIFGKVVDKLEIPEREVFPRSIITVPVKWEKRPFLSKFTAIATVTYDVDKTLTQKVTFWIIPAKKTLLLFGLSVFAGIIIILVTFFVIRKILKRRVLISNSRRSSKKK
jgi:hypothetical protein